MNAFQKICLYSFARFKKKHNKVVGYNFNGVTF